MKDKLAFDKTNFMLLAIGMVIVIIGFFLMTGSGTTEAAFQPDIFSFRRVRVAPTVSLFGFLFMIYGIVHRPKAVEKESNQDKEK
jgi:hypothetical protein